MSEKRLRETDEQRAERYADIEAATPVLTPEEYRKHSRRAFLTGGIVATGAVFGFRHIQSRTEVDRIPDVLRRGHEFNESVWRTLDGGQSMAPTFDPSESSMIRVNGRHGIGDEIDLASWTLRVEGPDGAEIATHDLADITNLAKVEMTTEHKCIEGWSHIVTWGGTPFSALATLHLEALGEFPDYVSLETPDGGYYVSMDMESMLHPQTLLAYELQNAPLEQLHGAPLRLATPNKYGIKSIKRIGVIRYTDERPDDYWGERGYDWYAQL